MWRWPGWTAPARRRIASRLVLLSRSAAQCSTMTRPCVDTWRWAECRAAEQAWARLTTTVEEALRGALREAHLPDNLAERMRSAAAQRSPAPNWLAGRRARIALVALPVLALIAFLVFPRGGRNAAMTDTLATLPPPPDARELIRRVNEYLYAP